VTARYDEAEKAREQKKAAEDLKKELAWSHVAAKEEEMKKKIEEVAKAARRLPKIEESLKEAQVCSPFSSYQSSNAYTYMHRMPSKRHLQK